MRDGFILLEAWEEGEQRVVENIAGDIEGQRVVCSGGVALRDVDTWYSRVGRVGRVGRGQGQAVAQAVEANNDRDGGRPHLSDRLKFVLLNGKCCSMLMTWKVEFLANRV